MEGDDKIKVVHRNQLLPLFSDPSDQTTELDTKSMVDQTVSAQEAIAKGVIASHVHILGTCGRTWVTNIFQRGMEFVTSLFE